MSNRLIDAFPTLSSRDGLAPMSASILKLSDQMKMAELQDPALLGGQGTDSRHIVDDPSANPIGNGFGYAIEDLSPSGSAFVAFQEQGIAIVGSVLGTWLEYREIQNPTPFSKAKPETVAEQDKRALSGRSYRRTLGRSPQQRAKPVAERLSRVLGMFARKLFEIVTIQQGPSKPGPWRAPGFDASLLGTDSPRSVTLIAPSSFAAPSLDGGVATVAFRMFDIHTCEIQDTFAKCSSINS
jgi:hypothetical protein